MENVKGLLSKKQRVHFEAILELFASAGYKLDWKLLNAWDYGVAQTRERVFIVGFRHDLDVSFTWPDVDPSRPVLRDAIGDLPDPVEGGTEIVIIRSITQRRCRCKTGYDKRARASPFSIAKFRTGISRAKRLQPIWQKMSIWRIRVRLRITVRFLLTPYVCYSLLHRRTATASFRWKRSSL